MLIRFRVQNHGSIRDEQTLSMVATEPLDDPRLLSSPAIAEKLVPVAAIYGANASGKSNLLDAMAVPRHVVDESHRVWRPSGGIPRRPFALSALGEGPSTYELDFIVGDARYVYGFELSTKRVEGEWLYELPRDGPKVVWFERTGDAFDFGAALGEGSDAIRGQTRPNSLFLSAAAQNNLARLAPISDWLVNRLLVRVQIRDQLALASQIGLDLLKGGPRGPMLDLLLSVVRDADVGVDGLRLGAANLPPHERIQFHHQGAGPEEGWLPLAWESAGTQKMFELAVPLLRSLDEGWCVCVDELEGSLHPVLASGLIDWFQQYGHKDGGQLIFTTHDTHLINRASAAKLRRDQIWFTEKNYEGATELYPLSDFESREQENLETGYLQGRYGAIPVLGDFAATISSEKKAG